MHVVPTPRDRERSERTIMWEAPLTRKTGGLYRPVILTGLLAVFPFIAPPGRVPVTATAVLITALAWRGADRAAARLGLFITLYLTSILLGSAYSQLSFGAAILLYLAAIRRVPGLRGEQPWLRWGQFGPAIQALCVAVAAAAGLGRCASRCRAPDCSRHRLAGRCLWRHSYSRIPSGLGWRRAGNGLRSCSRRHSHTGRRHARTVGRTRPDRSGHRGHRARARVGPERGLRSWQVGRMRDHNAEIASG